MKLKGILKVDAASNTVLAYVHQFPGVMAQGKDINDAKRKLDIAWDNFVKVMQKAQAIEYADDAI